MADETPNIEVARGVRHEPAGAAAGEGAAAEAMGALRLHAPSAVLVFASVRHDLEEVLRGVRSAVGAAPPILGATTAGEICDGIHHGSVVVAILASPHLSVQVGAAAGVAAGWDEAASRALAAPGLSPYFDGTGSAWQRLAEEGKNAFALLLSPGPTQENESRSQGDPGAREPALAGPAARLRPLGRRRPPLRGQLRARGRPGRPRRRPGGGVRDRAPLRDRPRPRHAPRRPASHRHLLERGRGGDAERAARRRRLRGAHGPAAGGARAGLHPPAHPHAGGRSGSVRHLGPQRRRLRHARWRPPLREAHRAGDRPHPPGGRAGHGHHRRARGAAEGHRARGDAPAGRGDRQLRRPPAAAPRRGLEGRDPGHGGAARGGAAGRLREHGRAGALGRGRLAPHQRGDRRARHRQRALTLRGGGPGEPGAPGAGGGGPPPDPGGPGTAGGRTDGPAPGDQRPAPDRDRGAAPAPARLADALRVQRGRDARHRRAGPVPGRVSHPGGRGRLPDGLGRAGRRRPGAGRPAGGPRRVRGRVPRRESGWSGRRRTRAARGRSGPPSGPARWWWCGTWPTQGRTWRGPTRPSSEATPRSWRFPSPARAGRWVRSPSTAPPTTCSTRGSWRSSPTWPTTSPSA